MTEFQAFLHSVLDYNEETGVLTWKYREPTSRANNIFNAVFAGKNAGSIVKSTRSKTSYLHVLVGGKRIMNHRVIFAMMTGSIPDEVDHIDHNGLNNQWSNLRSSSKADNARNMPMPKSNKSGYIGVNWHKAAKKWQARAVDLNGKRIDLGRYNTIEEAIAVRKKYEVEFKYYSNRDDVQ